MFDNFQFFDAHFFEMLFLICFALSWPTAVYKSWKAKTAKGKSVMFTAIALLGYVFGIISKFVDSSLSYTVVFYFINGLMVATDLVLTLRNMRLDAQRDALEGKA